MITLKQESLKYFYLYQKAQKNFIYSSGKNLAQPKKHQSVFIRGVAQFSIFQDNFSYSLLAFVLMFRKIFILFATILTRFVFLFFRKISLLGNKIIYHGEFIQKFIDNLSLANLSWRIYPNLDFLIVHELIDAFFSSLERSWNLSQAFFKAFYCCFENIQPKFLYIRKKIYKKLTVKNVQEFFVRKAIYVL